MSCRRSTGPASESRHRTGLLAELTQPLFDRQLPQLGSGSDAVAVRTTDLSGSVSGASGDRRFVSRDDFVENLQDGLRLHVRLTPRGGADRIDGVGDVAGSGTVLLARVRAVPEKGLANAALLKLISDAAGWQKSVLALDAGSKSRGKIVAVSGSPGDLAAGLARLRAAASQRR